MDRKNIKGFTFVEIIIVVMILSILFTISYISFISYTKKSRDVTRVSDLANISKSLAMYMSNAKKYPLPDKNFTVTASGNVLWYQGTFGDINFGLVSTLKSKPVDPLTGNEYTYSVSNLKNEFQLASIYETQKDNDILRKITNNDKNIKALIDGNYNGKILKIHTGSTLYVYAVPSIITSQVSNVEISDIIQNNELVYANFGNTPSSYEGTNYSFKKDGFVFNPSTSILVFTGKSIDLKDETKKIDFIQNIGNVYKGTLFKTQDSFKDLVGSVGGMYNDTERLTAVQNANDFVNSYISEGLVPVDQKSLQYTAWTKYNSIYDAPTVSSNHISSMFEDNVGNIWFGTSGGGVVKYDGTTWIKFTTNNGLSSDSITSIIQDNSGNMWFSTPDNGVTKYDGNIFTKYNSPNLVHPNVVSAHKDSLGNLWFTSFHGLTKFDGTNWTRFNTSNGLPSSTTMQFVEDNSGSLWFGSSSGALKYSSGTFTVYNLPYIWLSKMFKDNLGNIYAISQLGTYKFNGTTWNTISTRYLVDAFLQNNGDIVFSEQGKGITKYDGTIWSTIYSTGNGLPTNNPSVILKDSKGNIWTGLSNNGLAKYNGTKWEHFKIENLMNNYVRSLYQSSNGDIWVGTSNGLNQVTGVSWKQINYSANTNNIKGITQDNSGNMWFATRWGAIKTTSSGNTYYNPPGNTYVIFKDNASKIWFGTASGAYFINGTSTGVLDSAGGLINNLVYAILQDNSGNLWFGTEGGLSKYNGTTFTNYTTAQGLPSNKVYSITKDDVGNLWFGTAGGASKYDGSTFMNYTTTQGLSNNYVNKVYKDNFGNMWFGTNSGATMYDGNTFKKFDLVDGMGSTNVMDILQLQNGDIRLARYGGGISILRN